MLVSGRVSLPFFKGQLLIPSSAPPNKPSALLTSVELCTPGICKGRNTTVHSIPQTTGEDGTTWPGPRPSYTHPKLKGWNPKVSFSWNGSDHLPIVNLVMFRFPAVHFQGCCELQRDTQSIISQESSHMKCLVNMSIFKEAGYLMSYLTHDEQNTKSHWP